MKDAMKVTDTKAAVDKEGMEKVEKSTSSGLQEIETQVRSGSTSEEGLATGSFRIPL